MSAEPFRSNAPLNDDIANLVAELRAATERARVLYADLGRGEAIRRWKPETWSIAECVEHLNLTSRAFVPRLDTAIAELRRRKHVRSKPFQMEWVARWMRWVLEPPSRLRMPTTKPFVPVTIEDPETVYEQFTHWNGELVKRALDGAELALDEIEIASPFNERLRYNAWSAFRIVAAHERRHMSQAERVKARLRAANA